MTFIPGLPGPSPHFFPVIAAHVIQLILVSSYDGDLSLPLGLALGSPIFPSGCEGKLGWRSSHCRA